MDGLVGGREDMLVGGLADALEDGRTLAALDDGRISMLANGLGGVRVDVLEENRAEDGAEDGQPWLLYVGQSAGAVGEGLEINIKRIC